MNSQKKKDLAAKRVAQGALLKKYLFFLRSTLELVCSLFLVFPLAWTILGIGTLIASDQIGYEKLGLTSNLIPNRL